MGLVERVDDDGIADNHSVERSLTLCVQEKGLR